MSKTYSNIEEIIKSNNDNLKNIHKTNIFVDSEKSSDYDIDESDIFDNSDVSERILSSMESGKFKRVKKKTRKELVEDSKLILSSIKKSNYSNSLEYNKTLSILGEGLLKKRK